MAVNELLFGSCSQGDLIIKKMQIKAKNKNLGNES